MSDDDPRERPTLHPPAPAAEPPAEPPALTPSVLHARPVGQRSAFENMADEVSLLTAHVGDLRSLVLRLESSVQTMTATMHALEAVVKFSAEQTQQSIGEASEEVLRSRQAVVELGPRIHAVEERVHVLEHRRVSNGEDR